MYNEWSLDVFYKGADDPALELDMRQFEGYTLEDHIVLNGESVKSINTEFKSDVYSVSKKDHSSVDGGKLTSLIEEHSFNVIVLSKKV